MVAKKTVACGLLVIISILSILIVYSIPVHAANDIYINKVGDITIKTSEHYNPGDGETRTFDLIGTQTIYSSEMLFYPEYDYNLLLFFDPGQPTVNVGGASITINSVRYFIDITGMDRQYFYNNWITAKVKGVYVSYFNIGVEYNVTVTSTLNVDGYTWISLLMQDVQYQVQQYTTYSDKLQENANTLQEEANKTSNNIFNKISDFFNGFFDNLGNTVLGWIVPSSEELTEFLNEVNQWFSERLGFIWYPFSLAIDMVESFASGDANSTFNVPALELTLMGNKYKIWDSMTIDMDAFDIFKYVRYFTSVILVAGVVKLAYDKWDEWIGGHGVG